MTEQKTIKVRIAVAVNDGGEWNAAGWDSATNADAAECAMDPLEGSTVVHYVTAELPVPVACEVAAVVERDA